MTEEMQESFDVGAVSDSIAENLFPGEKFGHDEPQDDGVDNIVDAAQSDNTEEQTANTATEAAPEPRKPPQSWKAEMHEKYSSLPQDVQEYIELREKQMGEGIDRHNKDTKLGMAMRDVVEPFRQEFEKYGVDETTAVKSLLNAQYRLTNGTPEQRMAAYKELGKNLGFDEQQDTAPSDPAYNKLREELSGIKNYISQNQQQVMAEARSKIEKEVSDFASSTENPYFEEVSEEITKMISIGYDLKTAYDKAVWANPVTREKELSRIRAEQDKATREKNKQEAEAARKARSVNVTTRDTKKTPTGPAGTMSNLGDVVKETLREIRAKAH